MPDAEKAGVSARRKRLNIFYETPHKPNHLGLTSLAADPNEESAASKLWAVYVFEAEKYDRSLVESWKSNM